jgi:hypothetical protein
MRTAGGPANGMGGTAARKPLRPTFPWTAALALLLLGGTVAPAGAVSLWGMEGVGRPESPYDLAARGAGSAAIGVIDPFAMSPINPAVIAWATMPQADFALVKGTVWIKAAGDGGSSRLNSLDLQGGRVVLPLPHHISLGVGYRGLLDGSFQVQKDYNTGREDAFQRVIKGAGGVGELSGTLAIRDPRGLFAAGVQIGFVGGTLRDEVEDKYESSSYANSKYLQRTRLEGGRSWTLGLQGRPHGALGVGAFYRGKTRCDLRRITSSASRQEWQTISQTDLPEGMGGGISALVHENHRLAVDFTADLWNSATSTGGEGTQAGDASGLASSVRMCDAYHLGVGYAHLPGEVAAKDPVLRRAIWRTGFSWSRLPVRQSNGGMIEEWAVSGGVGLPVHVDRGFVNGLLELGRTGSLGRPGVRELFVRLGLGVTFGRFPSEF